MIGPNDRPPVQTHSFHDTVLLSTGWDRPLICNARWTQNLHHGIFPADTIKFCSNGGLKDCVGDCIALGTVISINRHIITRTMMKLTPEYLALTSYCCEACGILSALTIYNKLTKFYTTNN
jgi:hypothetical protein